MSEAEKSDFERLLRQSAEQLRVAPSGEVWGRIQGELHQPRRLAPLWWAAAALLLGAGIYGLFRYSLTTDSLPAAGNPAPVAVSGGPVPAATGRESRAPAVATLSGGAQGLPSGGQPATGAAAPRQAVTETARSVEPAGELPVLDSTLPAHRVYSFPAASVFLPEVAGEPAVPRAVAGSPEASVLREAASSKGTGSGLSSGGKQLRPHRWSWGIYVTPAIGYRVFSTGPKHPQSPPPAMAAPPNNAYFLNALAVRRVGKVTYAHSRQWNWSAGLTGDYALSEKWAVESGVRIAQTGYAAAVYEASPAYVAADGTVTQAGRSARINSGTLSYADYAVTSQPAEYHNHYLSVEVPVLIRRRFATGGRVSFDLGAGAGLSYLAASRSLIFSPNSGRYYSDKDMLGKLNCNLHFEADVVVPAGRKIQLTAGPAFQYQAGSTYRHNDLVREHPYFVGLRLGMKKIR